MRPKKRILLIDSNEVRLSVRRLVFETHRYFVLSASTPDQAREISTDEKFDLVVAGWPFAGGDLAKLLQDIHDMHPNKSSMLLAETLDARPDAFLADVVLLKSTTMAEVLERVKLLSACRRGPQKKPVKSVGAFHGYQISRTA